MTHLLHIECPCCLATISVNFTPAVPAVWYPNDDARPEEPAEVEVLEDCNCYNYLDGLPEPAISEYIEACLERALEVEVDR